MSAAILAQCVSIHLGIFAPWVEIWIEIGVVSQQRTDQYWMPGMLQVIGEQLLLLLKTHLLCRVGLGSGVSLSD